MMPIGKNKLSTLKLSLFIPLIMSGSFSSNIYPQIVNESNKGLNDILDVRDNMIPNSNEILDLSAYDIDNENSFTKSITLKHVCSPGKQSIYSNSWHNIPFFVSFNAVDRKKDNRKITTDQNCEGNCIKLDTKTFLKSIKLQIEGGAVGYVSYTPNEYSRCMGDTSSVEAENMGLYLAVHSSGNERLTIGAKLKYKNNKGEIKFLSTDDSEKTQIDTLPNPYESSSNTSLFSIRKAAEKYNAADEYSSYNYIARDNYKLHIISPVLNNFPTLGNSKIESLQLTNKDSNVSSSYQEIQFSKISTTSKNQLPLSNYAFKLTEFVQPDNDCQRRFHSGYFISGKLKSLDSNIQLVKKSTVNFSLSGMGNVDFGLATISHSCFPGWVGDYEWDVPFSVNFIGKDVYGNNFQATLDNFSL
jgi:hypothetical protein